MSIRILRRFLTTAASDSKSTPNLSVPHSGRPGIRYLRKCASELFWYTGAVSPFVFLYNHYANTRPRLKDMKREFLKDMEREFLKDMLKDMNSADDDEEALRHAWGLLREFQAKFEEDLKE
ncbi:hypothetical protein FNV43_RR05387 [Rhamnella rubrinervis]|uniref:Uncharacterized protein n=1 Tax=Rhamnella rubrinervis TaxID=2594499 RepID=A0A8K0MR16_9ROSA|nr:hypothetical protein FNV43_RR05387 [Rhamnella rubrinervis]